MMSKMSEFKMKKNKKQEGKKNIETEKNKSWNLRVY